MIGATAKRGYVVLYRPMTACPGCGRSNWFVGRQSAECACCGTALALAPVVPQPDAETVGG